MNRPTVVERFRQEVQAAARLAHPNIVTAYDADQEGDVHFLVMEFVEGTTLDRLVQEQGPLPVADACDYIMQAAQGLQHAFERGMVHRDIKPSNLLLTPDGQVKILDFGLARFISERTERSSITKEGTIVGTPDYMAPEQARDAHQADIRADIYSLGCTFYCLLTGGPPFTKGSSLHKLLAHQDQSPVPIADVRPEVPEQVIRLVERMLAKDPAERPQTPAEVAQALAPVHHTVLELDETILAAPSPRHESSPAYKPGFLKKPGLRLAYLAASIFLLCALSGGIGLAVWAVLKSGTYSPQDTTAVTQPTEGGTTNDSAGNGGTAQVAAVSPGVETRALNKGRRWTRNRRPGSNAPRGCAGRTPKQ